MGRGGTSSANGPGRARSAPLAVWHTLRDEGPRALWRKALAALGVRRLVWLERDLDAEIPVVRARLEVAVRLLEEADLPAYLELRPDADPAEIRVRLSAGHWCWAAWRDGRILCVRWAGTGRVRIEFLDMELRLGPDEAYSYDLFTHPAHRGAGLSPVGSVEMLRFLRDRGYRRMLVAIAPENHASLRSVEKTGYRRVGWMRSLGLGRWRWRWVRRTAAVLGAAFAQLAERLA